MKSIEFNKVPSWCPYTPEAISKRFKFNLFTDSGIVKYYCVHCGIEKQENINTIRYRIRKGQFTSLCTGCRGLIQLFRQEKIISRSVPVWLNEWLIENHKSIDDINFNLNSSEVICVYQGKTRNRGLKYKCIRCDSFIESTVCRIKTSIKSKTYTGLCLKCLSSVRNKVSPKIRKILPNGYVLIQKSLIPTEHHHLFNWSFPVLEHRYKMSVKLGRPLYKDEIVHHIDGNKQNNDDSNLELWSKSHPPGQRVEDKIKWAKDFLNKYNSLN